MVVRQQPRLERRSRWLTAVFATRSEADTLIVARADQYQRAGAAKVVVVSGDRRIYTELADAEHSYIMLDIDT
jgi:L-fucose mutarotase/ribose pyranase (RbsD/FucU family)